MGRPDFTPPPQATSAVPLEAHLPGSMELPPMPEFPEPGDHGMPELTGPTFPELNLPAEADGVSDLVMSHLPEIFEIDL